MEIRVTASGLAEAQSYYSKINSRLNDTSERSKGLFKCLNSVGDIFLDNFDTEGGRVGGWAPLADYTVAEREYLGMPGTNPIMFRDGALRDVTALFLSQAKAAGSKSSNDSYSGKDTSAKIGISSAGRVMTIEAHGWKVTNQNAISGPGHHPARPFWFVDNNVMYAARSGLVDWLVNDVIAQGVSWNT